MNQEVRVPAGSFSEIAVHRVGNQNMPRSAMSADMTIEFLCDNSKATLVLEHGVELKIDNNSLQDHVRRCYLYSDSLKARGVIVNWISSERITYEFTSDGFPEIEIIYIYHNEEFTDIQIISQKEIRKVSGLSDFELKEIIPEHVPGEF